MANLREFFGYSLALVLFAILFISSNVLALYLNTWIGKIIVRSPKKKLISTILMFFSTFGAIALIFFLNFTNGKRMASEGAISDYALIPYFRGYYDTVHQPFSLPALFHFWLPLLVIAIMLVGIVKRVMPKYYEEALYVSAKMQTKKKTKPKSHAYVDKSLSHLMRKHHLSTIQDSSLLIQTFLMPLIYIVGFTMPLLTGGNRLMSYLTNDYFGIAFAFGIIIASMCVSPSSFVGVGISVEKDNFIFLKSLPIVFTKFLKEKFYFLLFLQVLIPIIFYTIFLLLVIKVRLVLAIAFVIGYLLTCFVQGQWMYKRDLKHLNLKWQNMTQLYTRSGSQWLTLAFIMGSMMIGFSLIALLAILSMITHQALLINSLFVIVALIVFVILELILKKIFGIN
ncbi:ABC transporter permease [Streptococcus didelphis]|uniref:ABC transporter permease n=1 Tax=Streptococcus didelphis TaxID=102886 RepID=UPI0027D2D6EF|nr:ABC transporter permease [Streptococcus didelphis]WMB29294.1 ABC transporter permease [Streptococcus didelphis]